MINYIIVNFNHFASLLIIKIISCIFSF